MPGLLKQLRLVRHQNSRPARSEALGISSEALACTEKTDKRDHAESLQSVESRRYEGLHAGRAHRFGTIGVCRLLYMGR
eukprot:scaffold661874_cov61-Prasinocladus_malaysianus.AAC.1